MVKERGGPDSGTEPYDAKVYTLELRERDPKKRKRSCQRCAVKCAATRKSSPTSNYNNNLFVYKKVVEIGCSIRSVESRMAVPHNR